MESIYLLVPLSVLVILGVMVVFAWALKSGQFEDLQREGERILTPEEAQSAVDSPPKSLD